MLQAMNWAWPVQAAVRLWDNYKTDYSASLISDIVVSTKAGTKPESLIWMFIKNIRNIWSFIVCNIVLHLFLFYLQ